ncbi:Tellurite resistance protein TerB [Novipirellula galeiformis]|uniref:Tellurite resistance protein TerB n=1 Tax=Novipirellula galeiformis TaxID=2528004 RepID=A0A5C6CJE3_9BACT|nr:TerB family tellurite resistance protein [Novipirellula galeiformis]TWU22929.1 Tellurite resistance protein TerB [Novipirellula galeiformis]
MNEDNLKKRRLALRNLVVMAFADGSLGEREVNLVADRCADLGLNELDLQQAVEFGLRDEAVLELPSDKEQRGELLADLIRMMAADGILDESEKRLFALTAVRMELTDKEVDEIISRTLENHRNPKHP